MDHVSELFWQSPLPDIKRGYIYRPADSVFICLICGKSFEKGVIYRDNDALYEAEKMAERHITREHSGVFQFLVNLDKRLTGLTEHQKNILELLHQGYSDKDIAARLDIGSTSTIRNHRFSLREKQKQAKLLLAVMELLAERIPAKDAFVEIPRDTRQVDDRFAITAAESQKVLATYFKNGPDGPLEVFPLKEKKRVIILRHIIQRFEADKKYSEKEVNAILKQFYSDYVLVRRLLIDYGFLDRTVDGSAYWLKL
jgi:hypothetical protein